MEQAYSLPLNWGIFDYLSLILSVPVIIIHLFGIYLVKRILDETGVKYFFYANCSIWCILWALSNIIRYPLQQYCDEKMFMYWTLLVEPMRIPYAFSIIYISMNPLLAITLRSKHQISFFSRYQFALCMLPCCAYSLWLIFALPCYVMDLVTYAFLLRATSFYMAIFFNGVIVAIFFLVYLYIGFKFWKESGKVRKSSRTWTWKLGVPCIVVLTFLAFETLPDFFMLMGWAKYGGWTIFLFRVDTMCNAFAYCFLKPKKYLCGENLKINRRNSMDSGYQRVIFKH